MDHYSLKDGLNYALQLRWNAWNSTGETKECRLKQFPDNSKDLLDKYYQFEKYMNENKHPSVNLGAAVSGSGLLTDHGVDHVKAVINHSYEIISNIEELTGYEIYILLMAIHFHDLGNIYGRDNHEERICSIIEEMGDRLDVDTPGKEYIIAIATAHGGHIDGDKDTISRINLDEYYGGVSIRPKVLAAILRFADEISDDFNRTVNGPQVPKCNEVFHEYSKALSPVSIKEKTISFHYRIPYELTQRKVGKGNEEVYLYDEIIDRLGKCMRELEYCRKYSDGLIKITTIDVRIDYRKDNPTTRQADSDSFRLSLHGYPNTDIFNLNYYLDSRGYTNGERSALKYTNGEELRKAMKTEGENK